MNAERYAVLIGLHAEARGLEAAARSAFLDARCADDPELRELLERMLATESDDTSGEAFSEQAIARSRQRLEAAFETEVTHEWIPERIGDYEVLRRLGAGGMGIVYEAAQRSPRRKVAIKLLHPLHATPERLGRFRQEAELLGRLTHPGIAQIHEAGTYDAGRGPQPFFAMECVEGVDLRSYCDREGLGLRERLQLLARICDAVQYAHERDVVHRDLKPENILVDGRGQPKILDFGIARTNTSTTALSTIVTEDGQLVGTLAYMAPEQMRALPGAASERVDVYALGVLGFELATHRLPIVVEDLPLAAAVRHLEEAEAPRAGTLDPALRGDVETILGKALEADPDRRYGSAAALAGDIRRYLDDLPIEARPPTRLYRMQKFTRRHRALVIGTVATVLVFAAGLTASLVFAAGEREARTESRRSEARVVSALMDAVVDNLERGRVWEAREQHRVITEANRDWTWRLTDLALPRVVEAPGAMSVVEDVPGSELPVWEFLDEDRICGLDRARGVFVIHTLSTGARRELFADLRLEGVGPPTETGLVVAWRAGEVLVLDVERARVLSSLPAEGALADGTVSDDGRVVCVRIAASEACLWVDGEPRRRIEGNTGRHRLTRCCTVSPDGKRVFVNRMTALGILDVETGIERTVAPGPGFDKVVGTPLRDCWVSHQFLDSNPLRNASRRQPYEGPLDLSGDGTRDSRCGVVHATSADGRVIALEHQRGFLLRDGETGEPLSVHGFQDDGGFFPGGSGLRILPKVSPGGTSLLASAFDRDPWWIQLEPRHGEPGYDPRVDVLRGREDVLYHVAVSHDDSLIASLPAGTTTLRVWDARSGETVATLERRVIEPQSRDALLAFSPDDERLVLTTPLEGEVGVGVVEWNLATGEVVRHWPETPCESDDHSPLHDTFIEVLRPVDRDRLGKKVQMAGREAVAVLWLYRDGYQWSKTVREGAGVRWRSMPEPGRGETDDTLALSVHPELDRVALISGERPAPGAFAPRGSLWIRSLADGRLLRRVEVREQPWCVAWSPDGRLLAVGTNGGRLLVYETEFYTLRLDFKVHDAYVYAATWTSDGERIVTVSRDGTVRIIDARPVAVRDAERAAWIRLREELRASEDLESRYRAARGDERAAARVELMRQREAGR